VSITSNRDNHSPGGRDSSDIWDCINDKISANIRVMLLYVLESEGSSPGRKGFRMVVSDDGELFGTIGGGIMEFKFVEKARSLLRSGMKDIDLVKQFHDKKHDKDRSGMICSGSQLIALIPLNREDSKTIIEISKAQNGRENKTIRISPAGIKISEEPAKGLDYKTEANWVYTESINQKPVIHIVGGGHAGLALTGLMSYLGFYVVLYDDRPGLNTVEQNLAAHEKHFIDYDTIGEQINIGRNDFVVIMTIGYRTDKIVLKQLLQKEYFYLGLLGSEKKNERLFKELAEEGADTNKLDKVFAPIGMNIFSKTAREIAVSIAAQIILERNRNLPTGRTKPAEAVKPVETGNFPKSDKL